jgi:hypothetical protein
MRRRIIAHQHHGQTRHKAPTPLEAVDFLFDLFLNFFGDRFTVDDNGHDYSVTRLKNLYKKKVSCKPVIQVNCMTR